MKWTFEEVLHFHLRAYPSMTAQDACKLAYQSEFGPEHLLTDMDAWRTYLRQEWLLAASEGACKASEPIGNGLCRFHLSGDCDIEHAMPLLEQAMLRTAKNHRGTSAGLEEKLRVIEASAIPGAKAYVAQYRAAGCPTLHHSDTFRNAYRPHYRVISEDALILNAEK